MGIGDKFQKSFFDKNQWDVIRGGYKYGRASIIRKSKIPTVDNSALIPVKKKSLREYMHTYLSNKRVDATGWAKTDFFKSSDNV